MKKKLGDLTLREIKDICKNHTYFSCEGCPLDKDYVCMGNVDLQALDKLGFENFEESLDKEIEVAE